LPYLRFDGEAQAQFLEWRTNLEGRLRGSELHPAMESHLAKYRKLVPGLALILHLAGNGSGPVGCRAVLQALAWAEYLETHARRAYASVSIPEVATAREIINRLKRGDIGASFSARDIWRQG
jgi:putative DNA primase/helicase